MGKGGVVRENLEVTLGQSNSISVGFPVLLRGAPL